jgi:hypothetical protein
MRYLCLIYDNEQLWLRMPKAEQGKLISEYFALDEQLKRSGQLLGGAPEASRCGRSWNSATPRARRLSLPRKDEAERS